MRNGDYELIIACENYPGKKYRGKYVYEHHYVWWKNTGIIIPKGFVIHHIDHNKRNNSFSNLMVMNIADHNNLHHKKEKELINLKCALCEIDYTREARNITYKINAGQKRFYCSRSHQVMHQHKMFRLKNIPYNRKRNIAR